MNVIGASLAQRRMGAKKPNDLQGETSLAQFRSTSHGKS